MQVPTGHMDGLPLGIQLIGLPHKDEALLRYAKLIEPILTPENFHAEAASPDWLALATGKLTESKM